MRLSYYKNLQQNVSSYSRNIDSWLKNMSSRRPSWRCRCCLRNVKSVSSYWKQYSVWMLIWIPRKVDSHLIIVNNLLWTNLNFNLDETSINKMNLFFSLKETISLVSIKHKTCIYVDTLYGSNQITH